MKTYYDYLKEQLSSVEDTELEPVKYLPEIFRLMCFLANEEIDRETRWKINCALAYLVNSEDIIDEDIHGAEGYMDDLYVCCLAMTTILENHKSLIERSWPEAESVIYSCYKKSEAYLDRKHITEQVVLFSRVLEKR